ncbi:MAG: LytTR family DNA-binding domain-containing protein [Bacteroidota bacterium]
MLGRKTNIYGWLVTCWSGLFMFISLFIYRSYHIDQVEAFTGHGLLFRSLVHAFIISLVFYTVEFLLAPAIRVNQKIKPLVTAVIATIFGLNLTFIAFNYFFHWTEMSWTSYSMFLYEYPLILFVPVSISYLASRIMGFEGVGSQFITIISSNTKEQLQLKPENLLYVKSADNYVEIVHKVNGIVNRRLIRKKLKSLEKELAAKNTLRKCHRSYLVNPNNIEQINKTTTRMELIINGEAIPISKNYVDQFISAKTSPLSREFHPII